MFDSNSLSWLIVDSRHGHYLAGIAPQAASLWISCRSNDALALGVVASEKESEMENPVNGNRRAFGRDDEDDAFIY